MYFTAFITASFRFPFIFMLVFVQMYQIRKRQVWDYLREKGDGNLGGIRNAKVEFVDKSKLKILLH